VPGCRELIKGLAKASKLQYCGYQKYNSRHNKRCGLHEDVAVDTKPPSAVDFAECGTSPPIQPQPPT